MYISQFQTILIKFKTYLLIFTLDLVETYFRFHQIHKVKMEILLLSSSEDWTILTTGYWKWSKLVLIFLEIFLGIAKDFHNFVKLAWNYSFPFSLLLPLFTSPSVYVHSYLSFVLCLILKYKHQKFTDFGVQVYEF